MQEGSIIQTANRAMWAPLRGCTGAVSYVDGVGKAWDWGLGSGNEPEVHLVEPGKESSQHTGERQAQEGTWPVWRKQVDHRDGY